MLQLVLTMLVAGTSTERRQPVALAGLPASQYMYRLLVNGQPMVIPQRLVVR